jgi:xanthine/CO dehydrogenase XdhC/CoxF family maturation factor
MTVAEAPHERLVLLHPLGSDQAHEQSALGRVLRGVEGGKLVAECQLVAVLLNQVADVVTLERHREPRTRHRVAIGPRRRVRIDLEGLVVARDHDNVMERLALHRALRPHMVIVGMGSTKRAWSLKKSLDSMSVSISVMPPSSVAVPPNLH